jgi:hypothetical protein
VTPARIVPQVGGAAEIVTLASRRPAVVASVHGPTVEVDDGSETTIWFELHPLTGRFVRKGEPYWGTRLELLGRPPEACDRRGQHPPRTSGGH